MTWIVTDERVTRVAYVIGNGMAQVLTLYSVGERAQCGGTSAASEGASEGASLR